MRLHIGKAFNFLKLNDYLEEVEENKCSLFVNGHYALAT